MGSDPSDLASKIEARPECAGSVRRWQRSHPRLFSGSGEKSFLRMDTAAHQLKDSICFISYNLSPQFLRLFRDARGSQSWLESEAQSKKPRVVRGSERLTTRLSESAGLVLPVRRGFNVSVWILSRRHPSIEQILVQPKDGGTQTNAWGWVYGGVSLLSI
jgi:hypothetical protein